MSFRFVKETAIKEAVECAKKIKQVRLQNLNSALSGELEQFC